MKFLILALIAAIPTVCIEFLLLNHFEIFHKSDLLLYVVNCIVYCLVFLVLARLFHLVKYSNEK
jgi:hypothetical protein